MKLTERLRHYVTGAIERGEATPVHVVAPEFSGGKWFLRLRHKLGFVSAAVILPGDGGEETQKAARVALELWSKDYSVGQIREITGFDFFLSDSIPAGK